MKKVLGVVLLILCWCLTWVALLVFCIVAISPPSLEESGEAPRLFLYGCLTLLGGALTAWGGVALAKRWRILLGVICIVMGIGAVMEGATMGTSDPPKVMEVISPMIVIFGIISLVIGIGVIAHQKHVDRKVRVAATGTATS